MKSPKVRLVVAAALFLAWIGYLVYLAATTTRPVVLSRPQFLAADLYVIARLHTNLLKADGPAETVKVSKVVWSKSGEELAGKDVDVRNLTRCKRDQGWVGPGEYILALTRVPEKEHVAYEVTPIPRSPGYYRAETPIYPVLPDTLRQLERIKDQYHPQ